LTSARHHFPDELRGFALLGIILVNAPFLGISTLGFIEPNVATWWDRLAAALVVVFAQAKFYLIFSFLFGYSYTLFVRTGGKEERRRFARRLLALAVLGLAHGLLLFQYDILLVYAVVGLGLVLFGQSDSRVLWRVAAVALAVWAGTLTLLWFASIAPADQPAYLDAEVIEANKVYAVGSAAEVFRERFIDWQVGQVWNALANGPSALAMFMLGVLAGRRQVLAQPEHWQGLWRRGSVWGLLMGLPLALVSGWMMFGPGSVAGSAGTREMTGVMLGFIAAPPLTLAYIAWLARLHLARPDGLRFLRASGRMSLTVYLGESLVLSLIFMSYGLGLYGTLGAATVLAIAVTVWVAMEMIANVWLRHADQGPLEALMRSWVQR
jgi:uncharacterized protein